MSKTEEAEDGTNITKKYKDHSISKLLSPQRLQFLNIEAVLEAMKVDQTSEVLDIGSGVGVFTIPFSKCCKSVHAVDISEKMVEFLESQVEEDEIENIEVFLGEIKDLQTYTYSHIFMSHILHEIETVAERQLFKQELLRLSYKGSKIGVIEWKKEETGYGPPLSERLKEEEIIDLFSPEFSVVCIEDMSDPFYFMVLSRMDSTDEDTI